MHPIEYLQCCISIKSSPCHWLREILVLLNIGATWGYVTPQLVPRHNWSPGPSAVNYVAVDGPPGPSMAAMDGPLCRKWSPGSKPEKQWLYTATKDLYNNKIILTDKFEVNIKIFRNNAMHACLLQ